MEAIEEIPILNKKGRRKKIVDSSEIIQMNHSNEICPSPSNYEISITSVYKKKTKGAKIIDTLMPLNNNHVKINNIILLLKCSIREIDEYIQKNVWNYDNLNYNPNVPTEIIAYEQNSTKNIFGDWKEIETEIEPEEHLNNSIICNNKDNNNNGNDNMKNIICSVCNNKDNNNLLTENEYQKIKQLKIQFYKNDLQDKKSDCFWCTYPFDNDPCYILQYGYKNDIYGHGSFCSPECAVAYLFGKQMDWDDSAKTESYQLMNYYYGKPNQFQQSIKPALIPYYLLEKFYGNLTIQEYRKLTKSQHMLLIVEKPITRILPEIHEDNDTLFKTTYSNGGKYKVKKQSEKTNGPNRNSILREKFGLNAS